MRDYDPTTGRYIQADPLGLVDGASVYGYALQNPGRYVDPRGENTVVAGSAGGFIVGGPPGAVVGGIIGVVAGAWIVHNIIPDDPSKPGALPGSKVDTGAQCKNNCNPSESPVWQKLLPHKGPTKTNGLSGKKRRFYQWDYTHCDIEVYNKRGIHLGSMDPLTGVMYKGPAGHILKVK